MNKAQDIMQPIDVNAGRLIPKGNLNPSLAGSFGALRQELDKKQSTSKGFQSKTSYNFQPGYTTTGLNDVCWDCTTF